MIFWIDAQLPPTLAEWLAQTFSVQALSLRDLGLRDARDREIFFAARQAGAVVISKDSDFVDLVEALDIPPQILWVTCGNATNQRLRTVFATTFPQALNLLREGRPVVEIADAP
ncbi:MAG TPA: DUF5615 family PIN-like protein [Rhodocyclaceae bacterium]|nr:DUF5615 family PIN-like protein [Rhodocyclaceae bacterium]